MLAYLLCLRAALSPKETKNQDVGGEVVSVVCGNGVDAYLLAHFDATTVDRTAANAEIVKLWKNASSRATQGDQAASSRATQADQTATPNSTAVEVDSRKRQRR